MMNPPRVAHVWVKRPHNPEERPGLILGWVRVDGEQRAVVVVINSRPYGVVTELLAAEHLRPIEATPRIGSMYDIPK